jgi:hypothetical protein
VGTPVGDQELRDDGWPAKHCSRCGDPTPVIANLKMHFHSSEMPNCPALHHDQDQDLSLGRISTGLGSSVLP